MGVCIDNMNMHHILKYLAIYVDLASRIYINVSVYITL